MKTQALSLVAGLNNPNEKMNFLREYLQAFVLRSFHESEAFKNLAFVGGTALRFLFGLKRFSEDLDFCLEFKKNYDAKKWFAKLKRDLSFARFKAEIMWSEKNTVHKGWIKLSELLKEAGISDQASQKLSIKIEIDTLPPRGAVVESKAVNKHFLMGIRFYDLPSLMAGKIHALICRPYAKGRDYYDFLWYRTQTPSITPNLKLLQNALNQTQTRPLKARDWKKILLDKIEVLDFNKIVQDVETFLENPQEKNLLTKEFLIQAIET